MRALFITVTLAVAVSGTFAQRAVTTRDELDQFADLSALPAYRAGTHLNETSTYDRTGQNDDGFSGKYSFIRRNADSSLVVFEAKGPGVINRIWTPTPTEDTFDIYIDDSVFAIKYADLFSGKVKPFTSPLCGTALGGNYCYYPILFSDSCKIVCRGKKMQFHQIQWRSYPAGTKTKNTFEVFISRSVIQNEASYKPVAIKPKSSVILFQQKKNGGRINSFNIYPASVFAHAARNISITISYDGVKAVACPAADFFGFASGNPSMNSWLLGVRNDTAFCNLPMPFDKNIKLEIENLSLQPIAFRFAVDASNKKRDPAKEGKLFTEYRSVKYAANSSPHLLLDVKGKGHFVGTILKCQGTDPGMTLFFEGDDSTVVDGRTTLHGTGSEDYFNGGWYAFPDRWDDAFSLPFHGSLEYSLPLCRTGAYRFYLSDKIPFDKSFYHTVEHGPIGNNIPAIYTSLSFYYGDQAPALSSSAMERPIIFDPDTLVIYPQLNPTVAWNGAGVKTLWAHNTGGLSHVYTVSDETMLRFSLEDVPTGNYNLYVDFDKIPGGAAMKVMQRQSEISGWMETYSADSARLTMEKAGEIAKTADLETLSILFQTSPGKTQFFLNRFVLVRKK